ncbi:Protein of unknown function (DUF2911) [Dyadobacter jejuensis]|uniref:DUF2911 family protein n=1 Tax=Dyadobacter jejuensis TaxID=1082580 RepID=A0A316B4T6_9BACT|nr:DUF2911 domain-containing protein [Dyadobacter jejuensis]PWJ57637.1 Protein of unknown function (DUF2911) [Dyadobacter jejuensis]
MKVQVSTLLLALTLGFGTANAQIRTPEPSPSATVSQAIGLGTATISYSRPSLKGRKMFNHQVPYGSVWRTGANKITNLTLSEDMEVAGHKLAAGTYALFTIPTATEWTIILNNGANQWGSYTYDQKDDVLRFKVKPEKLAKKEEHFTIDFTDFSPTKAHLSIRWENTAVKFAISQDPHARIMAQIKDELAKADVKASTYLAASNYYFDTKSDQQAVYDWAKKAVDLDPKFWTHYYFARAAALNGKCEEAIVHAKAGLAMAKEAGDQAYVINNQSIIDQCSKK